MLGSSQQPWELERIGDSEVSDVAPARTGRSRAKDEILQGVRRCGRVPGSFASTHGRDAVAARVIRRGLLTMRVADSGEVDHRRAKVESRIFPLTPTPLPEGEGPDRDRVRDAFLRAACPTARAFLPSPSGRGGRG